MPVAPALYSGATDEWPTQQAFFDRLNRRYRFTLEYRSVTPAAFSAGITAKTSSGF
jgi:hypothetical protein